MKYAKGSPERELVNVAHEVEEDLLAALDEAHAEIERLREERDACMVEECENERLPDEAFVCTRCYAKAKQGAEKAERERDEWRRAFEVVGYFATPDDARKMLVDDEAHHQEHHRQQEATQRELERWKHGKQVEGDYVCPDSVALAKAREALGKAESLVEDLRSAHDRSTAWALATQYDRLHEVHDAIRSALREAKGGGQ